MAHYLDTSALAQLVVVEPESRALHTWVTAPDRVLVSSDLARTELLRAVLDALVLLRVTTAVVEEAALLEPAGLRSLDAVHLASALALGDDLDGVVTYDDRLAEACALHGVPVVAPA